VAAGGALAASGVNRRRMHHAWAKSRIRLRWSLVQNNQVRVRSHDSPLAAPAGSVPRSDDCLNASLHRRTTQTRDRDEVKEAARLSSPVATKSDAAPHACGGHISRHTNPLRLRLFGVAIEFGSTTGQPFICRFYSAMPCTCIMSEWHTWPGRRTIVIRRAHDGGAEPS
jgi:hypothetical protein